MKVGSRSMKRQTAKRLLDALTATEKALRLSHGRSFAEYERDEYFRSAVERQLEIVSEALNLAARDDDEVEKRFPELPRIVGLRNKLAHGYDSVDDQVVWDTVAVDLPGLQMRLVTLLDGVID
ncbi:DUF86 domain-containing protein [soil metagenome]